MPAVRVIRPGLQTTVQDLGRWGWQARGVPVAGPMDPYSHRIANALVGNGAREATLEIALIGPELEFEDDRVVAVAGAHFAVSIDGRAASVGAPLRVHAGERLRFGLRTRGSRAYLAIGGGVSTPLVLGSRATHLVSRMGGMGGRALAGGDRLPLGEGSQIISDSHARGAALPAAVDPVGAVQSGRARVRVVRGPQLEWFADDAFAALQAGVYTITPQSDRMGFRLQGPQLSYGRTGEMISDAMPFGAVQVPPAGEPILLMADRQTTGGYPAIATVISADIGMAGQLGPGDEISFIACTLAEARIARAEREEALRSLEAFVRG
jgi:antagonist of KipI